MNLSAKELALVCLSTEGNAEKYVGTLNRLSIGKVETLEETAMFLSSISYESGRLSTVAENLSYSAKRMCQVWPKRFPTLQSAGPYEYNPKALANRVYNGRMGNQAGSDDGWNFRGRGLKQLTGRDNYTWMAQALGLDLLNNPDLLLLDQYAASSGMAFWVRSNGKKYAAAKDFRGFVLALNGGLTGYEDGNTKGLDDRVEMYEWAKTKLKEMGLK